MAPTPDQPGASAAWVFPPDEREYIADTTKWPYRLITHLVMFDEYGEISGYCSGMVISTNAVLTAAHCVFDYDSGDFYERILFVPGENGANFPFGTAIEVDISIPQGYADTGRSEFDIAVVKVSGVSFRPSGPFPVVASASDAYFQHPATFLFTAGYPGDKPLGTQWFSAAPVEYADETFIYTTMDAYPGQSGSPIFTLNLDYNLVHVVGTYSFEHPSFNAAVRFTPIRLNALIKYCANMGCSFQSTHIEPAAAATATATRTQTRTPTPSPSPTRTATLTVQPSPTRPPTRQATATPTRPPGSPSGAGDGRPFKLRAQQLARDGSY